MDKAQATLINRECREALQAVFERHGLRLTKAHASFDEGTIRITATAETADAAAIDWKRYAASYGLPEDALGKTISFPANGKSYVITGMAPGRSKYPVKVTDTRTGKAMLITVRSAKQGLGLPVQPWD